MDPKVSINLCCYNSERYLRETLDSIGHQTFRNWELIIINDGSTDSTESIIHEYVKRGFPIIYAYQENRGLSNSRNRAIEMSKGEYIALIDHDDVWEADKLELQVKLLEADSNVGLVYSNGRIISEVDRTRQYFFNRRIRPYRGKVADKLIRGNFIVCSTVVMRRDLLSPGNAFRPEYKIIEEYELFIRLAEITEFDYIEKSLATYRLHGNNTSKDLGRQYTEENVCLCALANSSNDAGLKAILSKRISDNHVELAILYLLQNAMPQAKKEMESARANGSSGMLIDFLSASVYLPYKIRRLMVFTLKKSRSALKRLLVIS